ncbi:MAG: hypothetical protein C0624_05025 [Desulfuromonas sp.]|nr:MAG: hypothetical protein C0624_05025 [Desulfuromonas sp.]
MSDKNETSQVNPDDFRIDTLDDEIRADRQCTELLKGFAASMVQDHQLPPLEAGQLAHGADPFLRDYLIANRRENLFQPSPGRVRQFAGHFYIVNNMEPNRRELASMLAGIEAFYRYCLEQGWVNAALIETITEECAAIDDYAARIESFWDLKDDGFIAWRQEIPIDK